MKTKEILRRKTEEKKYCEKRYAEEENIKLQVKKKSIKTLWRREQHEWKINERKGVKITGIGESGEKHDGKKHLKWKQETDQRNKMNRKGMTRRRKKSKIWKAQQLDDVPEYFSSPLSFFTCVLRKIQSSTSSPRQNRWQSSTLEEFHVPSKIQPWTSPGRQNRWQTPFRYALKEAVACISPRSIDRILVSPTTWASLGRAE